jgi:cell wall-associated NlpC family hydrolase
MPSIKPKRQENGSLTGVRAAGEGAQAVTPDASSPVAATTDPFGESAVNAARPEEPGFGEIWDSITPQTSFNTQEFGGQTSMSTSVSGGGFRPAPGKGGGLKGIADFAKQFIGTPYVWGGTSPSGFDCSGFTQYVMKQFGINLPRISYQQGQGGKAVANGDLQVGDLVFWDNSSRNAGADHVGIYIGGGKYIHAPQPGSSVKISNLGGNYWARRYGAASNAGATQKRWGQTPV